MALAKHIVIAAGHGAGDSGAIGQGTTEDRENQNIVNRVVAKLQHDGRIAVTMVPHSINLRETIDWINARFKGLEDALSLEVHKNSGGGTGSEVWAPSYPDATSKSMAAHIAAALAAVTGQRNRGVKEAQTNRHGRLGFTDDTNTYALLVEAAFIDVDPVGDAACEMYAEGIYQGILRVFGLGAKPAPAPTPAPAPVPAPRKIEKFDTIKLMQIKPHLTVSRLWDTTFNAWPDAKAVTSVNRINPTNNQLQIIEIAGEIRHPLGAIYLVTKSSADRGSLTGFNSADLEPYSPPTPVEQPKPNEPPEVPVETPKPTPTPEQPTDHPAPRDTEQDARIGALEAAVGGLITLLLSIGKALVDGVTKLKK